MLKRIGLVVGLVAVLVFSSSAWAQGPVLPEHSDPVWQASYWSNMTLSGSPVLQRTETSLDHDWGTGSPADGLPADGFSARWSRYLYLEPGTYRFTTTSDDGLRVYVDGTLLINEWYDHAPKTVSADLSLSKGHHLVVVEFYENTGFAVAKVSWGPVTAITRWRGEYFNNPTLSGSPALVRDDAAVNFAWGSGSPAPGIINTDRFSVRWTRTLDLDPGSYRFTMTVDDGVRLWVNGHLLIDQWKDQAPTTYQDIIYVPGGGVPIKVEYYENGGIAVAQLSWTKDGGAAPGTVVVDDADPAFVKGGSSSGWRTAAEGYRGRLLWTYNNDRTRYAYNWGRWHPKLAPGRYEVFVYIPYRYTTTAAARYWISHAGGYTLRVVSQSANGDRWVSLGTYRFRGDSQDYVSLADVTYEPYLSRLIAWDAVKWVPR
jgi:hypothetical protein